MKFKFILIFFLSLVNFQLNYGFKCEYRDTSYGYECELRPDTSIIREQQLTGINDDDINKIRFHGNNNNVSNFTTLQFPFCRRFKNVKVFDVYGIEFIDESLLQYCKNFNEVWIYDTKVDELSENFFANNLKLNVLVLSRNKLITLPENIFNNQIDVEELLLDNNEINFLPSKIFKSLTKLRNLYLDKNQIEALNPAWFESLANLQELSLGDNEITDLPENVFISLEKLEKLWLDGNQLTTIHADSFWDHKNLTAVFIRNNRIQAIDEEFFDLTAVSSLNMQGNICFNKAITRKDQIKRRLEKCFENYQPRHECKWN